MTEPDIETERRRIQKSRNLAMALVLGGLAVLFFFITMAKFGG
jgi:hypothetical protein